LILYKWRKPFDNILTLAVVVRPQDDKNIFDKWNESKWVDNKRKRSNDLLRVFYVMRKDVVENIKGWCAQISEYHTKALES
jgi:hypothetical protein